MDRNKVVLITGASSGIGLDAAERLCRLGYKVYGAARRVDLLKQIENCGGHSLYLDLTDDESIKKCVDDIVEKEGTIDVLVNNAGYGLGGALETVSMEEARRQFDVNLFGLARITQLVLPFMRNNGFGRIINISSIAGKFSSPFLGWYHATKYSVEAYSDALRMEVAPFGIKVCVIEPGLIQTNWGIIAEKSIIENTFGTAYESNGKHVADFYSNYYDKNNASDISVVSKTIVRAVESKRPKIRYKVGKFALLFTTAAKFFCDRVFDFVTVTVFGIR